MPSSPRLIVVAVVAAVVAGTAAAISLFDYRGDFAFVPNDVSVTIPEGTNIADIDRLIVDAGVAPRGTLLTPNVLVLEGTLFPDTYRFDRKSTADDIVIRMRRDYPNHRTLIIASLLEKEVRTEHDMRLVAGIIEKRLAAGMALQIDASVAYGVCAPRFHLGEYCDVSEVSIVDNLKRDSPYNTYVRLGLPAGPITNPGLKALQAASQPLASEYWYYVSAPSGTTIFSKTLHEHNQARQKYL